MYGSVLHEVQFSRKFPLFGFTMSGVARDLPARKRARLAPKPKFEKPLTQDELERLLMESDEESSGQNSPSHTEEDDGWEVESDSESEEDGDIEETLEDVQNNPSTSRSLPTVSNATRTCNNVAWASTPPSNQQKIQFSKCKKLLVIPDGNEPVDFFNLLVDERFYELLTTEINKYAEEVFLGENTAVHSRITRWKELTVDELRIFLGLLLHMGTVSMNRVQDYWKKDPLFNFPIFPSKMSRDRFLLILRCLHFQENPKPNEPKPQDRLFKIRPLLNLKMENVYYPGKNLSLDESMVLWRGRLVFRQYIKNKRHKYGIKLYMLTEPEGIVLKFAVYTGVLDDFGGTGHAANVVLDLMQKKLDVGHSLFMDNYYNSYSLALQLLNRNTGCTGTLRLDRKNTPSEIRTAKLQKGESIALYSEGVMIGNWRDKRQVPYISTEFGNDLFEDCNRRGQMKEKPEAIMMYNKYMGGVDRQDQLLSYYPFSRKCLRWYQKLGIHVIQLLLLNSYLLFKEYGSNRRMTFYDFRLHIIRDLLKISENKPTTLPQSCKDHTPQKLPNTPAGKVGQRRCRLCYENKRRKETAYFCVACPEKPPLCIIPCFAEYHRNK